MATITMGKAPKRSKFWTLFFVWVGSALFFSVLMVKLAGELHWPTGEVIAVIEGETTADGGCSGSATYRYETPDPLMSHEHTELFKFLSPCDETGQLMALLEAWAFKLLISGAAGLLSTVLFALGSIWRSDQLRSKESED